MTLRGWRRKLSPKNKLPKSFEVISSARKNFKLQVSEMAKLREAWKRIKETEGSLSDGEGAVH
jgi:hypothetical protein